METTMIPTYKVTIEGMHCHACERLVTANLSEIPGVTVLEADAQGGYAIFTAETRPDEASVESAIVAAGFKPAGGAVHLEPVEAPARAEDVPAAARAGLEPTAPPVGTPE